MRVTPQQYLVGVIAVGIVGAALSISGGASLTGYAHVIDGDTLSVSGTRVRLEGIDAPEAGQTCRRQNGFTWSCGASATAAIRSLVGGRHVTCKPRGSDRYGRTLATCFVDGQDINAAMVRQGYAWAYKRYSWAYVIEEMLAHYERAGIWEGDARPAWEYRHTER
jgi:endonuclease YncB( thermonuclease family)